MLRSSLLLFLLCAFTLLGKADKPLSSLNLQGFEQNKSVKEEKRRDPFLKNAEIINLKRPKLTMIVWSKKQKAALINGQAVKEKDKLGNQEVILIKPRQVMLKGPYGMTKLRLKSMRRGTPKKYYIEIQAAPIKEAIKLLAVMQNKNVVMPSQIGKEESEITASFPDISLSQAMQAILESRDRSAYERNNVIRIISRKEQESLGADLHTKVLPLKYAKAGKIKEQAAVLLSPRGIIMTDERTNSITIRDIGNYVRDIEMFIESIDFIDQQVLIEARVVEANTGFIENLGIQWGLRVDTSNFKLDGVPDLRNSSNSGSITGPGGVSYINTTRANNPIAGLAMGIPFSNNELDIELSAAETNNQLSILSKPSIITMNNQPATIHSGEKVYLTIPGALGVNPSGTLGTVGNLQSITTGITLVVTPQITIDGRIRMMVNVTSSQFNQASIGSDRIQVLDNNAQTQILLRDGETTVLGGLYQASNSDERNGVPLLSRIPFIGALFRNSSEVKNKRELLVFIKPTIIHSAIQMLDRSEREPVNPLIEK